MPKKIVDKPPVQEQPVKPGYTPFEQTLTKILRVPKSELDEALEREAKEKLRQKKQRRQTE